MKRLLITVFIFSFSASSLIAQTRWHFVNPKPTGFTLRDITMNDNNILWAVGYYGTLLYSQDEGESWFSKDLQTNISLLDITFHGNRGWIVGTEGTILFSDDYGQSWTTQQSGTSATLHKVEFIDQNIGWILASDSLILRTIDGGNYWESNTLEHSFVTSNRCPLNDLEFINPNKGWLAVGYYRPPNIDIDSSSRGALFKTIDGGVTWAIVDSGQTKYTSIFFLNELTGWIATHNVDFGGVIMRTDDGGETWANLSATFDWQQMYFADSLHGWGIYSTYIGKTIDGGKTWSIGQFMDPSSSSSGFKAVFFQNSMTGWAIGSSGFILKTNDSGESWNHLDDRLDIFYGALDDVVFTDENEGWIVGWQIRSDPEPDSSIVLHTIDGGLSWERQSAPYNSAIKRIRAIDNQRLWAIGGQLLFFTTDGGQNWHRSDFQAEEGIFRDIVFMDELNGFLLSNRTIYRTIDGGSSWFKLANGFSVQLLRRLCFSDISNGWVLGKRVGGQHPTYRTTDGGQTWYQYEHDFTAMNFVDSQIGFAVENGSVYRSLDGGNNWEQISENPASFVTGVSNMVFSDSTHGWIWNLSGVYYTNDGGRTWQIEDGISGIEIAFPGGLFMLNKDLGWAVGSDGWIFKYESDDVTSVSNPTVDGPSDFRLFDNYPNPFNSATTISYFLPFREEIEISVFNVLGEKVKVFFSGMQNPGLHQIEFDGSNLSSGVYFYQLKTKNFVEIKKSLLVK